MLTKSEEATKECREDMFCGVNTVENIDEASDLQKKHLPIISAPEKVGKGEKFEVTVEVGKLVDHPNEPGHFIEFIELYAGHTYLARMDFTAKTTEPVLKATVSLDHGHGKLRAFARCNLHGIWENDVDLEVD